MKTFRSRARGIIFLLVSFSVVIPFIVVFCPMGSIASATFDCDDAALFMYRHFRDWGFEVTIAAGNLKLTGETPRQCDHVWVIVQMGNNGIIPFEWLVPFDWKNYWGEPRFFDDQYHEYYPINYETLLKAVEADK